MFRSDQLYPLCHILSWGVSVEYSYFLSFLDVDTYYSLCVVPTKFKWLTLAALETYSLRQHMSEPPGLYRLTQ